MATEEKAIQRTWLDDTDDMLDGDFVKFTDGDEKIIKIIKNPVAGPIEFAQADGSVQSNDGLNIEVLVDTNPKIKTWSVTSKSLMSQIKAICVREGIGPNLAGSTIRVTASGMGMQRKYFVKLLSKPGAKQDQGAAWLDKERASAQEPQRVEAAVQSSQGRT